MVEYLSRQDLKLRLHERDMLACEAMAIFLRVFEVTPCTKCLRPESCRVQLLSTRQDMFSEYFPYHPPLDPLNSSQMKELDLHHLCHECRGALLVRERMERHKLWRTLPFLETNLITASAMSPLSPAGEHPGVVADASTPKVHQGSQLPSAATTSSARSSSNPLAGITRHPEFWFDDGNLILIANRDTAFRIYTGLLASQSEIFANMFAVASSSADETYEGCPVVPVYDNPVEFAHLLRVLVPKDSRT